VNTTNSHHVRIARNLAPYAWGLYRQVLDIFIPPCCVVCNKVETWLCDSCAQEIPLFDAPICPRCGRPEAGGQLCRVCQRAPLHVNPVRSAFLFEGHIRDVIHALKYRGARDVARTLGRRMAEAWRFHAMQSDVLVPVPLHPSREIKRGYNQAAIIAEALGHEVRIPVVEQVLLRVRNTVSQIKLNRQERQENVGGAFACVEDAVFVGKRVTLVDDVATTGATLNACAVALQASGAKSVNAFTLARAP